MMTDSDVGDVVKGVAVHPFLNFIQTLRPDSTGGDLSALPAGRMVLGPSLYNSVP